MPCISSFHASASDFLMACLSSVETSKYFMLRYCSSISELAFLRLHLCTARRAFKPFAVLQFWSSTSTLPLLCYSWTLAQLHISLSFPCSRLALFYIGRLIIPTFV